MKQKFRRILPALMCLLLLFLSIPSLSESLPGPEPMLVPAVEPAAEPTPEPTAAPTVEPTVEPTATPTPEPTDEPTLEPTAEPTAEPTLEPTAEPTAETTAESTAIPTAVPTSEPIPEQTAEPLPEPVQPQQIENEAEASPVLPTAFKLTAPRNIIGVGETLQLTPVFAPEGAYSPLTYVSGSRSIATIDENGLITAHRTGRVTIGAVSSNGKKAYFQLVIKKAPGGILITNQQHTICVGQAIDITYRISTGSVSTVSFSSDNIEVADFTPEGQLTGVAPGFVNITAETHNHKKHTLQFEVRSAPEYIRFSPDSLRLGVGSRALLSYELSEGSYSPVSFESDNPSVVLVNAQGLIGAKSIGTANIIARTCNGKEAVCTVEVIPVPKAVKVQADRRIIGVEETLQISATVLPEGADATLRYSSSTPAVASVDQNGLVTARRSGTAIIYAISSNKKAGAIKIAVKKAPSAVLATAEKNVIGVGEAISVGYRISTGSASTVSLSVSDSSIADFNDEGKLVGIAPGTVQLKASTHNGKEHALDIEVRPAPEYIRFNPDSLRLGVGSRALLSYELSEGSYSPVSFESDNPAVVLVNAQGLIGAKSVGTASIIARTYNGKEAVCTVEVVPAPKSVTVQAERSIIGVDETLQISATILPEGAAGTLTYISSAPKIASVDANGLVTAHRPGTAAIYAKTHNGKTGGIRIYVKKAPDKIVINADRSIVGVDDTLQFSAAIPTDSIGSYTFSSSNSDVISIDPLTGLARALAPGSETIIATTHNDVQASMEIEIVPAPTSVTVIPGEASICAGDGYSFNAVMNEGAVGEIRYHCENSNLASIDEYTGKLHSTGETGDVTIIARAYNGIEGKAVLHLMPPPEQVSLLSPAPDTDGVYQLDMDKGDVYQIVPDMGIYSALSFRYSSSDSSTVSVNESGQIYARRSGSAVITATAYGGASVQISVNVKKWLTNDDVLMIAHAMGRIDGREYSNSLEAFESNYAKGFRYFEVDFSYTRDNEIVLWHKWSKNQIDSKTKLGYVPTLAEFKRKRIYDRYTPLALADLLTLMDEYPDIRICTDTKIISRNGAKQFFSEIVSTAKEMGLSHVLDQFIIMVNNKGVFEEIRNLHPFRHYIMMTYLIYTQPPTAAQMKALASYCGSNGIDMIGMWGYWWKPEFASIMQQYGVNVATHTITSQAAADRYISQGVSAIITDVLDP